MPAPTVHMLSAVSFGGNAIPDPQSASFADTSQVSEYVGADSADIQLAAVDRIGADITVNVLGYNASPAVGDVGALVLTLKARAEGKGTTGSPVTRTYANAVCTGKGGGPVVEGSPTYSITFRAHAAPPA